MVELKAYVLTKRDKKSKGTLFVDFSGSLVREKFEIYEDQSGSDDATPLTVLGNRMVVPLLDDAGNIAERFVVRGKYMHSCIRMAARIIQTYQDQGPILVRDNDPFDWDGAWLRLIEDHDIKYHPDLWMSVYAKGKLVYEFGTHHMFFDVLEQCDRKQSDNYDAAITYTEQIFEQYGKKISIKHDTGVALVVNLKGDEGRCGVVLRGAEKTTTFNYRVAKKAKNGHEISLPQLMASCASFLEGIQLAFSIGMTNEKLRQEIITRASEEAREADSARRRLAKLNAQITSLEQNSDVRYRPEKPVFSEMVIAAEALMTKIIEVKREEEAAAAAAEEDAEEEWIT
tara:strand:+ start:52220 stop:53245 length:1026 start_codon:yes stop_codon:yes gene_type:complete